MVKNDYYSMNNTMTENDIQKYIRTLIPNIPYHDMWKIRERFIYDFVPLEVSIQIYKREMQIREWCKRKDKHYYKINMNNGGSKYVLMCEEMVKDFYGNCCEMVQL